MNKYDIIDELMRREAEKRTVAKRKLKDLSDEELLEMLDADSLKSKKG